MFLLDTVYFFRGQGDVERRLLAAPPSQIGIPSVALYELEYGVEKSARAAQGRRQLDELRRAVRVLEFGAEEARVAGSVRAQLERAGERIGPYDLMIAGTAMASGRILVTNNEAEFRRVPGLRTENWL